MLRWDTLGALLDAAPGDYSLCLLDAGGAELYAYQSAQQRPAASLIKVPIALVLYDAAAAGQLDLDEQLVVMPAQRVDGEGSLDAGVPDDGLTLTLRRLVAHSLAESDNTASNLLINRLGMETVNSWLSRHGFTATLLQRHFMDFAAAQAGRENLTSAVEIARLMFLVRSSERYAEPLRVLYGAADNDKLCAGLPPGTPIAHKSGELDYAEHDAGIIDTPRGSVIVSVMSGGWPSPLDGRRTIAAVARLVYETVIGELPWTS